MINLRNSEDGKFVGKFRVPGVNSQGMRKTLAFSPDGTKLAVSTMNKTGVHVWDVLALRSMPEPLPLRSIPTDSHSSRLAFTTDSRSVIIAPAIGSGLSIYDLGNPAVALPGPELIRPPGNFEPEFTGGPPVIVSGLSPNHGLAWAVWQVKGTGSPKAEVRAWDATGRVVFQMPFDSLEDWYAGHMTRDGKRLILIQTSRHLTDPALDRSKIQVWDLVTRVEVFAGQIPGGRVSLWGIDPDGRTLAISRRQQSRPLKPGGEVRTRLSLWSLSDNRETHGTEIDGTVDGAVMSQDGSRVAWATSSSGAKLGRQLRVWDTQTGQEKWSRDEWGLAKGTNAFGTPTFSPDVRTLVVANGWGNGGNQFFVLDAVTGRDLLPPLYSPDGALNDLRVSADGRRLFALASTQTNFFFVRGEFAVVWDLVTGRKLLTLPAPNARALTIDREGRRIYLVKESPGFGKLELEMFDGTPFTDQKLP